MWPFTKSRDQKIAECDHEWEEQNDEITYPVNIFYDDGEPFIQKTTLRTRSCIHCPKSEKIENIDERVFFEVSRTEKVE